MKKRILLILVCVALLAVAVWADNSKRIAELQERQKAIVVEINDRQGIIAAQQATIDGLKIEFTKIQGAIEELQRQDAEAKAAAEKQGK